MYHCTCLVEIFFLDNLMPLAFSSLGVLQTVDIGNPQLCMKASQIGIYIHVYVNFEILGHWERLFRGTHMTI